MASLLRRAVRFGLVGSFCTGLSYLVFRGMLELGGHYLAANAVAWAAGVGFGFVLNRRYTFDLRDRADMVRQLGLFVAGSGAQLALSSVLYAVLIGRLQLTPTPAFALNLAATASFMFVYTSLVAFRSPERAFGAGPAPRPV